MADASRPKDDVHLFENNKNLSDSVPMSARLPPVTGPQMTPQLTMASSSIIPSIKINSKFIQNPAFIPRVEWALRTAFAVAIMCVVSNALKSNKHSHMCARAAHCNNLFHVISLHSTGKYLPLGLVLSSLCW